MITINLEAIGMFIFKSLITIMSVAMVVAVPSVMIYNATDNEIAEKVATITAIAVIVSLGAVGTYLLVCLLFGMLFELWGLL